MPPAIWKATISAVHRCHSAGGGHAHGLHCGQTHRPGDRHRLCPDHHGGRRLRPLLRHRPRRGSSQSICAWATSDKTGISMKLYTTQPGIQLYTANFLQDCPSPGKGGKPLQKYGGFALETQHYPCSPSHPEFPSTVLRPARCSAPLPPCASSPASSAGNCNDPERTAAGNGQPSVFFLPFAQRGPSIHLRQTKNALKSEIAKLKMQQIACK